MWREGRHMPGYSLFDWLHGYVYGRWPYLYIGVGTGGHPLTRLLAPLWSLVSALFKGRVGDSSVDNLKRFADGYHGKVILHDEARRLVSVNRPVSLKNLETIIPYAQARDIILNRPDHLAVLDCPCRASRKSPCLPLDVCLIVGEPFAGFILEHHPRRARPVSSDEALAILEAEHRRGHVHHAFFKDAVLGRFYAICNCCACCCGAMQAWRNGVPMLASSGYVSQVSPESCSGCGICVNACPFEALGLESGVAVVEQACCLGCGVCESICPQGAHSLVLDPHRSEPLKIAQQC
jgi:ferredoxin